MKEENGKFNVLSVNMPDNLYSAVISRIDSEKRKSAKRRLVYVGVAIPLSLAALVETFIATVSALSRSGFYGYFSLIFSDGFAMASSWKEFFFSLVQSFSFSGFIVLLSLAFVILLLVRSMIRNINQYKYIGLKKPAF